METEEQSIHEHHLVHEQTEEPYSVMVIEEKMDLSVKRRAEACWWALLEPLEL